VRTMLGFLAALYLVLTLGCGPTFTDSRATCLGRLDSPQKAVQLVVPHMANAMLCASKNVEDDKAAIACVEAEFAAFKAEAEPVVYACGITLISDVVSAGKKTP
jgi:hypothetical protein